MTSPLVRLPAPAVHMSNCPRARRWSPDCSWRCARTANVCTAVTVTSLLKCMCADIMPKRCLEFLVCHKHPNPNIICSQIHIVLCCFSPESRELQFIFTLSWSLPLVSPTQTRLQLSHKDSPKSLFSIPALHDQSQHPCNFPNCCQRFTSPICSHHVPECSAQSLSSH